MYREHFMDYSNSKDGFNSEDYLLPDSYEKFENYEMDFNSYRNRLNPIFQDDSPLGGYVSNNPEGSV